MRYIALVYERAVKLRIVRVWVKLPVNDQCSWRYGTMGQLIVHSAIIYSSPILGWFLPLLSSDGRTKLVSAFFAYATTGVKT